MTRSADTRTRIAARVAAELSADPQVSEVWLEGALSAGLAHARSDIDLRVIFHDQPPMLRSRVVDGVRVDVAASTNAAIQPLRDMLACFDVRFNDVERFRQVRVALPQLTRLRTAVRHTPAGWQPVATADENTCYRRWAVTDRVEQVLSLVEDLLGLTADRLYVEADLVYRHLELCLLGLDVVAAGQPLLGDKWLPALWRRAGGSLPPRLSATDWSVDDTAWFPPVRTRTVAALTRCWPDTSDVVPPPPGCNELGWLPQRYTDGWFLRRGDERIRLTPGQLTGWLRATCQGD